MTTALIDKLSATRPLDAERLRVTVGKFPPPSLMCVVAELKRERSMRERVYPRLIDNGTLSEEKALYQQRCLEEAIDLLEGLQVGRKAA